MTRSHKLFALYLVAVLTGLGSAVLAVKVFGMEGVTVGAWRADLLAGSADAGPYTRARIAVNAVLALDRSETIYFLATHDDRGQPLRAECRYRLQGRAPEALWWSITAYASDNFLFPVESRRYSISATSLEVTEGQRYTATVGPDSADIETLGNGPLRLTLRLYKPSRALQADPAILDAPAIAAIGSCP